MSNQTPSADEIAAQLATAVLPRRGRYPYSATAPSAAAGTEGFAKVAVPSWRRCDLVSVELPHDAGCGANVPGYPFNPPVRQLSKAHEPILGARTMSSSRRPARPVCRGIPRATGASATAGEEEERAEGERDCC